jgi:hypothetical protein
MTVFHQLKVFVLMRELVFDNRLKVLEYFEALFEFSKTPPPPVLSLGLPVQALKYRSVTDLVRPIREIVRRKEETTGHSVRPK